MEDAEVEWTAYERLLIDAAVLRMGYVYNKEIALRLYIALPDREGWTLAPLLDELKSRCEFFQAASNSTT